MSHVRYSSTLAVLAAGATLGWLAASGRFAARTEAQGGAPAAPRLDRAALPLAEPSYPPITALDARKAKAPPRFEVKAPKGRPTSSSS
jgi:arylsulfatase